MLGLFRRQQVPPPVVVDYGAWVEERVQLACQLRDEMACWPTPLQAWLDLQKMPVLQVKAEPKVDINDVWRRTYEAAFKDSTYVSTTTAPVPMYLSIRPKPSPVIYDGKPGSLGLLPSEYGCGVGDILIRGNGRYQVIALLGMGRANVVLLRD